MTTSITPFTHVSFDGQYLRLYNTQGLLMCPVTLALEHVPALIEAIRHEAAGPLGKQILEMEKRDE